jgi:electron transfer flavoprotein beta subunit
LQETVHHSGILQCPVLRFAESEADTKRKEIVMPAIATCFKWVVDEADLKTAGHAGVLKTDDAERKISDYDRNALEAGAQIYEALGGNYTVVSAGIPSAKTAFKDALSRGADSAVFINDPVLIDLEPAATAKVLASALQKTGSYDLIIFGEGSGDLYAQQVGPMVAELMELPVVTYVTNIALNGNQLVAERALEDGTEVVGCDLPAVVTVSPSINTPRIPGLKQIMGAGKKPVTELSLSDLNLEAEDLRGFSTNTKVESMVMKRKNVRFEGDLQQTVEEAVRAIIREGCVS